MLEAAGGAVTAYEGGDLRHGKADAGFRNGWLIARGGKTLPGSGGIT